MQTDTLLTAVYCITDDQYRRYWQPRKPVRPGPDPVMSDSEVLTLMLLAQFNLGFSERNLITYVRSYWRAYFPHLLSQSAFNRRVRDLWGVLCALGPSIAASTEALQERPRAYEVLDSTAVPLMRRCRGDRGRLFGKEAAIGYGGSDHDWYYGVKLLAAVNAAAQVTGFVVGPANTAEHWLTEALLRWRHDPTASAPLATDFADVLPPPHHGPRVGPTGPMQPRLGVGKAGPLDLADLGFRGRAWQQHWQAVYGVVVLTPRDMPAAQRRWFNRLRHVVERSFSSLIQHFGLHFPRARTLVGLLARLGAKIAAHNLLIHLHLWAGEPPETHPPLFA